MIYIENNALTTAKPASYLGNVGYKGRQKSVDDTEIRRRAAMDTPKAQIARDLGISRMSVYRALKNEPST